MYGPFLKTATEIRDFSFAKLVTGDEDSVIVIFPKATGRYISQVRGYHSEFHFQKIAHDLVHRLRFEQYELLSQTVHAGTAFGPLSLIKPTSSDVFALEEEDWPIPNELAVAVPGPHKPKELRKNDLVLGDNDCEITVAVGLGSLLKDSWTAVQDYTINWAVVWGTLVQLAAWLLGGFDLQIKVVSEIIVIFVVTKALLNLKAGEFGLAFWRIFHFPLWMLVIALGTLGDMSLFHVSGIVSLRTMAMIFVTSWCLGGSVTATMTLLGLKQVEHFRKGFKRLIRETFSDEGQ